MKRSDATRWGMAALGLLLAAFVAVVFLAVFEMLDRREETDRFIARQALVNDLDTIDHRIAEKERARCEERFIKDVVTVIRRNPDPAAVEAVTGCFGPTQAEALRHLYERQADLRAELDARD